MTPAERARLVRLERKAFRAAKPPRLPTVDSAGISTKPWGRRRMVGIGLSGPSGPSRQALDFWHRQTGTRNPNPLPRRRKKRGLFALGELL